MIFRYPAATTSLVRRVQATLVLSGGIGYALQVQDHLSRLEELVEERFRNLLDGYAEKLRNGELESVIIDLIAASPDAGLREDGTIYLRLLRSQRERFYTAILDVFSQVVDMLIERLDTDVWEIPIPLDLVATTRHLYELCVLTRREWSYVQNYFQESHGVQYSIAPNTTSLEGAENPGLVSSRVEDLFWDFYRRLRGQLGPTFLRREDQALADLQANLDIELPLNMTDEDIQTLLLAGGTAVRSGIDAKIRQEAAITADEELSMLVQA